MSFGWDSSCIEKSQFCDGCNRCVAQGIVKCPKRWLSFGGKCYRVRQDTNDYYNARMWCEGQNASLVSINDADENHFIWRICRTETLPITYDSNKSKATCWLGIAEKGGDATTPQELQKWTWLDGSEILGKGGQGYNNWALRPGMGNGDGDGNRYFEPNNEKTARTPLGDDVRHAVINQLEGGMMGYWYDKTSQFRAHAICEKER